MRTSSLGETHFKFQFHRTGPKRHSGLGAFLNGPLQLSTYLADRLSQALSQAQPNRICLVRHG